MNVVVYVNPKFEHQRNYCGAFVEGLAVHGIKARVMVNDIPVDCDLAVMWSHGPTWANVIADRLKKDKPYIVLDAAYLGSQLESASISINGLHGESHSCVDDQDHNDDRSKIYSDLYKPWKPGKNYVLLMGQLAGDASLQKLDINAWLRKKVEELHDAGYKVIYRPHPRAPRPVSYGIPYMTTDLEFCFKDALCVYTYSSTSGVEALLNGKPVIAESPISMAYEIAGHSVADIKKIKKEPKGRAQWFNRLAYRQYTIDEIRSGVAFEYCLVMGSFNV